MENYVNVTPRGKRKINVNVFAVVCFTILALFAAIMLLIFAYALLSTFKSPKELNNNVLGLPKEWKFENYMNLGEYFYTSNKWSTENPYGYFDMFTTSLLYAFGSAFFQTACTAIAAYCTAKYKGAFSNLVFNVVLVTIALPIVGGMTSLLQIMESLALYTVQDGASMIGMWIMKFGFNSMYYFIFYAAFSSLSWEYAESAFMDGANHFSVCFRIMLPLVANLIGAVFLLLFIAYWNDFETPYVFLDRPTLSIGLYATLNGWSVNSLGEGTALDWAQKSITGVMVFLPIFIIFIIFRNKIMGNLTEGGIKA